MPATRGSPAAKLSGKRPRSRPRPNGTTSACGHIRCTGEAYLEGQQRFAHLFRPERNQALIDAIQARVGTYWDAVAREDASSG